MDKRNLGVPKPKPKRRKPGAWAGKGSIAPDFDILPDDFMQYFQVCVRTTMPKKSKLQQLSAALLYFRMPQLRQICEQLQIPAQGQKGLLIERILVYLETGKLVLPAKIPAVARAQRGVNYPLVPSTLMLFGNYKNDAKTRAFFKQLIGPHFHFTAQGVDWLKARWLAGHPPTYQEFADYWQAAYLAHKTAKPTPKAEWAYINYVQAVLATNPNLSKTAVTQGWLAKQAEQAQLARQFIAEILSEKA